MNQMEHDRTQAARIGGRFLLLARVAVGRVGRDLQEGRGVPR